MYCTIRCVIQNYPDRKEYLITFTLGVLKFSICLDPHAVIELIQLLVDGDGSMRTEVHTWNDPVFPTNRRKVLVITRNLLQGKPDEG